ncbi:hypothetical protein [Prauserella endophytica]|uniref:Uncharacterized protein n=1 Tax=Prauserella endophytica TaxID=1592324 RepID=A0ABY2S067_9PSEU|nr:hypothetical protein [Prauserella endophytica]TKG67020.1 hypothetical protein FCN18_24245 [Prauserella endophytica]
MTRENDTERVKITLHNKDQVWAVDLLREKGWPWERGADGRHRKKELGSSGESVTWTLTLASAEDDTLELYQKLPIDPEPHRHRRPSWVRRAAAAIRGWMPSLHLPEAVTA